jgi:opacity protein-like surface antigen
MGFTMKGWAAVVVFAAGLGLSPAAVRAQGLPVGTVGLGAGGSFGSMVGDSWYGNKFSTGGGFNLLLRYTATRHLSVGLNFQNQSYSGKGALLREENTDTPINDLVMTTYEAAFLFFRNRNADASQYASLTLGFYRPELRIGDSDTVFPGGNVMFSGGLGVELYLKENWAIDLQGRAIGYLGDDIAPGQEDETNPPGNNLSFGLHAQAAIIYFILK